MKETNDPSLATGDVPASFGLEEGVEEWMDRVREAETPLALGCIGPYELIAEVSRGGQGIVYKARQPGTKRSIAVKRMLAGSWATSSMRKRFEREIELAASLNHPNVVTVHGIEVVDGQPLLAMEWIDGVPIDVWANGDGSARRSPREVANMLCVVCDAVRHAHQRGVIHRDLKPSNILVDKDGVPHVLDFGLARSIAPGAADGNCITLTEQFVGTPAFASPEHLRGGSEAIDVRADVYSLGVILYNSLTGQFPYDVSGDLPDVFHNIEHADPIRPSLVSSLVDREIESITLKALCKDKQHRYQTVDAFGDDLRRYLKGESIIAHPPSTLYQVRKLVRQHQVAVAFTVTVFVFMLAFAVTTAYQAVRIAGERNTAQREAAKANAVVDFLQNTLGAASPEEEGRDVRVVDVLARAGTKIESSFPDQPEIQSLLHLTLGQTYRHLGQYQQSEQHLTDALRITKDEFGPHHEQTLALMHDLAHLLTLMARWDEAERLYRTCHEGNVSVYGEDHVETLSTLNNLAAMLYRSGRINEAAPLYRKVMDGYRRTLGSRADETLTVMNNLAMLLRSDGKLHEALPLVSEVLDAQRKSPGPTHPLTLTTMCNMGLTLLELDRLNEADPLLSNALAVRLDVLGPDHPDTAVSRMILGNLRLQQGRLDAAERLFRDALDLNRKTVGARHPKTFVTMNNVGKVLLERGRSDEAIAMQRPALQLARQVLGDDNPHTLVLICNLCRSLVAAKKVDEAEQLCKEALARGTEILDESHWRLASFKVAYADVLTQVNRYDDAERFLNDGFEGLQAMFGDRHVQTQRAIKGFVALYEARGIPSKASYWRTKLTPTRDHRTVAEPTNSGF